MPSQSPTADKYRGATIEDLDPPQALSLTPSTPIHAALSLAYQRDFTHLTLVNKDKNLLGYVRIPHLEELLTTTELRESDPVSKAAVRFKRLSSSGSDVVVVKKYRVITPQTTLADLEKFFKGELGMGEGDGGAEGGGEDQEFAVVTDAERKFVLGVVTKGDLDEWNRRRGSVGTTEER